MSWLFQNFKKILNQLKKNSPFVSKIVHLTTLYVERYIYFFLICSKWRKHGKEAIMYINVLGGSQSHAIWCSRKCLFDFCVFALSIHPFDSRTHTNWERINSVWRSANTIWGSSSRHNTNTQRWRYVTYREIECVRHFVFGAFYLQTNHGKTMTRTPVPPNLPTRKWINTFKKRRNTPCGTDFNSKLKLSMGLLLFILLSHFNTFCAVHLRLGLIKSYSSRR